MLDWYDTDKKCSINITYFDLANFAFQCPLTLHGQMLISCLGYVLNATRVLSTLWIASVNLMGIVWSEDDI